MQRIFTIFSITLLFIYSTYSAQTEAMIKELAQQCRQTALQIAPSIVTIKLRNKMQSDSFSDWFGNLFTNKKELQSGTGFLISEDGYILTSHYLIAHAEEIMIELHNGAQYEGMLIDEDPELDLALLKIDANQLPFSTFRDSDTIELGEWVITYADGSISLGILKINLVEYPIPFTTSGLMLNDPKRIGAPIFDIEGNIIGMQFPFDSQPEIIPSNVIASKIQHFLDK